MHAGLSMPGRPASTRYVSGSPSGSLLCNPSSTILWPPFPSIRAGTLATGARLGSSSAVTTIVTGLGIGGIAVALAAQNILGDLFNYFVIFFDRPFEEGLC